MAELIDRQELMAKLYRMPIFEKADFDKKMLYVEKSIIDQMPTVDAVPVVHGRWLEGNNRQPCSVCRYRGQKSWKYCPNCGAKMDGGAGDG